MQWKSLPNTHCLLYTHKIVVIAKKKDDKNIFRRKVRDHNNSFCRLFLMRKQIDVAVDDTTFFNNLLFQFNDVDLASFTIIVSFSVGTPLDFAEETEFGLRITLPLLELGINGFNQMIFALDVSGQGKADSETRNQAEARIFAVFILCKTTCQIHIAREIIKALPAS